MSAATNAFVSHLGTVAGNGYKVMVNGVEYNVDSTKMAGAVADLHAVLGGLQSGGEGSDEMEVVFAEQALEFALWESMGMFTHGINPTPFKLALGESYIVVWDGEQYTCVAQDMSAMGEGGLAIGGLQNFGGTGNEPFIIGHNNNGMSIFATDTATSHTVAIYKVD